MNRIEEHVYLTRENSIDVQLREDGAPVDITALTRARLELFNEAAPSDAPAVVDSTLNPTAFDWSTQGAAGVLIIKLGAILSASADYLARLVVYDAASPQGLIWTHEKTTGCSGTQLVIRAHAGADAA